MKTPLNSLRLISLIAAIAFTFGVQSCNDEDVAKVPVVNTLVASDITYTSAIAGGSIKSTGGAQVISKGVCIATTPMPTIDDTFTEDGDGSDEFISTLSGLIPNTTYFLRAYATNSVGTGYGSEVSFKTNELGLAVITTITSAITETGFTGSFEIVSNGGSEITSTGFCFSTSPNPTTMDYMMPLNEITEKAIYGLPPSTTYYVRAFAYNSKGLAYGNEVEISTLDPQPVTDVDGNVYETVYIGSKFWFASDLQVTKYNNGDAIPTTTADISAESTPSYQWSVDNDDANASTYGRLYTYFAVADGRNVCPVGTHVSTMADWSDLKAAVEGNNLVLKESGDATWLAPNTGATNELGFNATGSGYRSLFGFFMNKNEIAFYMTKEVNDATTIKGHYIHSNESEVVQWTLPKKSGFSVRCVKD